MWEEPGSLGRREAIAKIASNLGSLLVDIGRREEAEGFLRNAVNWRREIVAEDASNRGARSRLAITWINLGAMEAARRKNQEAEAAFKAALDAIGDRTDPLVDELLQQARAWNNLGVMYQRTARLGDAVTATQRAISIKEELSKRFPSVTQYQRELASGRRNLGLMLASTKRPIEARKAYEESIANLERLRAMSKLPMDTIGLAASLVNLGKLIGEEGGREESLPHLTKGIELLEPESRANPQQAQVRESLHAAYWNRAATNALLKRFPECASDYARAIELDGGRDVLKLRFKRASALINVKDHASAAAEAEAMTASVNPAGNELIQAAGVFAYCIRFVDKGDPLAEQYARSAVAAIGKAKTKGFRDVSRLKSSKELQALQSRQDFQKVIAEMEANN